MFNLEAVRVLKAHINQTIASLELLIEAGDEDIHEEIEDELTEASILIERQRELIERLTQPKSNSN